MRIKIINDILPFLYGIQILYLQDIPIQTSHISTAQQPRVAHRYFTGLSGLEFISVGSNTTEPHHPPPPNQDVRFPVLLLKYNWAESTIHVGTCA